METLNKQAERLEAHGIKVIEIRSRQMMVVVRRKDLEAATELRINDEVTIASRA